MRTSIVLDMFGAVLVAGAVLAYFAPIPGSFWGNTFFGIPYLVAVVAVPVVAALCAATACWVSRRRLGLTNRGAVVRGIAIAAIAFALFSIFHGIASALVVVLGGEGAMPALITLVTIPFATAFWGGIFVLPICCVVAVAGEWLADKIAA